jgi:RNA polymerase sigma-70 factor (ECF subfamily)
LTSEQNKIEKETLEGIVSGDQEAFTVIYDRYAEKVFYFALRYLKSTGEAENLTQEVFVKIWETRERLDPGYSFDAYLFTIVRNAIFNIHRKKLNELAYLKHLERVFLHSDTSTDRDFQARDLQEQIDRWLVRLPPQRGKVFSMSRKEGMSHKEIATALGISEKTVAAHIRLSLKTLRKLLSRELKLPVLLLFMFSLLI